MIRVQQEDFDIGAEIAALKAGRSDIGAIVTFIGTVRDQHGAVAEMTLEHYPGMTESELTRIEAEAHARWPLQASLIVHRTGTLKPGDNIVAGDHCVGASRRGVRRREVPDGLSQDRRAVLETRVGRERHALGRGIVQRYRRGIALDKTRGGVGFALRSACSCHCPA